MKRRLATGVTSGDIDRWYALARDLGAYGGKIAGAGGGGYLLLCVPEERRDLVRQALQREGLMPLEVAFDHQGCRAITGTIVQNGRGNRAWNRELQDAAVYPQS